MKLKSLNDLFVEQLKDVYSAEKQILQALPKMAKAASAPELQQAFQKHLEMTQQQKDRLDQIFQTLGATPGRTKCKGMEGLLAEGEEMMASGSDAQVTDAALIAAAQKVEHYEIATYGTLRTYAKTLGNQQVAGMLQQTLNEEGETDHLLSRLAEQNINRRAEGTGDMGQSQMGGSGATQRGTGTGRSMSATGRKTTTRAKK